MKAGYRRSQIRFSVFGADRWGYIASRPFLGSAPGAVISTLIAKPGCRNGWPSGRGLDRAGRKAKARSMRRAFAVSISGAEERT